METNEVYLHRVEHREKPFSPREYWRIRGLQGEYWSRQEAEKWLEVWKQSTPGRGIKKQDAERFHENEKQYRQAKGIA